jgi:NAD(P)-dependent dehydrogenase (short-subunit alcohol dehydrogenase family)
VRPVSALERLLDLTVAGSYGRPGFEAAARRFDPADDLARCEGRVLAVTGATAGIGLAAARMLAQRGAVLVVLGRPSGHSGAALAAIAEAAGGRAPGWVPVDMSEPASVRAAAQSVLGDHGRLDGLLLNAGVLLDRHELASTGIERSLSTNLVGPELLRRLLDPALQASGDGRVVHVSSGGMYSQRLELEKLQSLRGRFDGVVAYAQAKRAQLVLLERWAQREAGSTVRSNAMHPGWADTPGVLRSLPRFYAVMRNLLRTPEQGADSAVWLLSAPRARGLHGAFVLDRRPRATHLLPWTREPEATRQELYGWIDRVCAPFEAPLRGSAGEAAGSGQRG